MELLTGIHSRHSISRVRPDPVPKELIVQLLSAAVQAPNHHHNRPWHFTIVTGPARERLGEVMVQSHLQRVPDAPAQALEVERKRPLRAPVLIAVGVDGIDPTNPKIFEIENLCASATAVENLLLAAHDLGLGAIWRTGAAVEDPAVKEFLGFTPEQSLIAIVYLGYPEKDPPIYQRLSYEDRVTWLDEYVRSNQKSRME